MGPTRTRKKTHTEWGMEGIGYTEWNTRSRIYGVGWSRMYGVEYTGEDTQSGIHKVGYSKWDTQSGIHEVGYTKWGYTKWGYTESYTRNHLESHFLILHPSFDYEYPPSGENFGLMFGLVSAPSSGSPGARGISFFLLSPSQFRACSGLRS